MERELTEKRDWAENISTVSKRELLEPVAGHRALTTMQVCRLARLVKQAMGCVE